MRDTIAVDAEMAVLAAAYEVRDTKAELRRLKAAGVRLTANSPACTRFELARLQLLRLASELPE